MKIRGLLVAAILLAGLTGTLYWSNRHMPAPEGTEVSTPAPKILSLNAGDINKVEIKKDGQPQVSMAKNPSSGKWSLTTPELTADQDAVSGVLMAVASLNADRVVDDKASDLGQYGLSNPSLEVDISSAGGKENKLLLGDNTPTGNGIYAKLAGDPRVFSLATFNKETLNKTANDLRDKRLVTFDADKISRLELVANKQDLEFGRNQDEWQIVKPKPMRADGPAIQDLIRNLQDAKIDTTVPEDEASRAASAFASGAPTVIAKVTDESGTQELDIRKQKDDYYAKSSVVVGAYKVSSQVAQALDKNLDDFRNKKLFDFGFDDPNKIDMHDGSKGYFFTRSGLDWWSNGTKMDLTGVQSFIDKLRDLSAAKFSDTTFGAPAMDIAVASGDGKRNEKILISKSSDSYLAERENDPTVYQLDAKTVDDLRTAASDVKPAAPQKKK